MKEEDAPKQKILVVDDDAGIRDLFSAALEIEGFEVLSTGSGYRALELGKKHLPSLAIMDLYMPEMNGVALIEEFRAIGLNIPIIVVTGDKNLDVFAKCVKMGISHFVQKPFEVIDVMVRVRMALEEHKIKKEPPPPPSLLLLIKTSFKVRGAMEEKFLKGDCRVYFAENNFEAIDRLMVSKPDVIAFDMDSPPDSPVSLLQILKKKGFQIPVLLFAKETESEEVDRLLAMGAKAAMKKPIKIESFLKNLARFQRPA